MNRPVSSENRGSIGAKPYTRQSTLLTLGISPVIFSEDRVRIGRLAPGDLNAIKNLRREHGRTHAFRRDARDGKIANISVQPGIEPMGKIEEVAVGKHLLLLAVAINHQLHHWLSGNRKILRHFHPLICLGDRDRLLTEALRESGVQSPDKRLDVVAKWSFDLRLLASGGPDGKPSLGLIVDVGTSNVIDVPVSELLERKVDPVGRYVGMPGEVDDLASFSPFRLLGRVKGVEGGTLVLEDMRIDAESDRFNAADVFFEARRETLDGLAPFQWTVSCLSFSTRDSRRCGNCGSRVTASKRLWESRSDFQGLVSFHNG